MKIGLYTLLLSFDFLQLHIIPRSPLFPPCPLDVAGQLGATPGGPPRPSALDLSCDQYLYFSFDFPGNVSKHLKGHLAPRVSNVTFLDQRVIPGSL